MRGYDETTYGERWGPLYDDLYPDVEDSVIDLLARHAGNPPRALELAVGTGRIALPLRARGVHVTGIDASEGHRPTSQLSLHSRLKLAKISI